MAIISNGTTIIDNGTLATASQPNITSVGKLTSFESTGIDDNATSTAITIDSSGNIGIKNTNPGDFAAIGAQNLVIGFGTGTEGMTIYSGTTGSGVIGFADGFSGTSDYRGFIRYNHTNDDFEFGTSSTEVMRIDSSGNVGIGTSSPTHKLHISSSDDVLATFQSTDTGARIKITDSTDTGYVNVSSGKVSIGQTDGLSGNNLNIDSSGNVGIGNSSPSVPLDVTGITRTLKAYSLSYAGVPGSTSAFGAGTISADANWGMYFRATTGAGIADFAWVNGAGTERMRIDNTGNVGIGTSSPEEKLDLGNAQPQNFRAGQRTYLGAGYSTGGTILGHVVKAKISTTDGASPMESTETNSAGGAPAAIRMTNGRMEFHTAGSGTAGALFDSERMRIDSSGNVGIGTSSPGAELDVLGAILSPSEIRITNTGGSVVDEDPIGKYSFYTTDGSGIGARELASIRGISGSGGTTFAGELGFYTSAFNSNVVEAMRIDQNGNVGIGTSSPLADLHLSGSGSTIRFTDEANSQSWQWQAANDRFEIRDVTQAAERFTVLPSGKIGINTTTPDAVFRATIIENTSGHGVLVLDRTSNIDGTLRSMVSIERSGTVVGTITSNNTSTSYNTSSDYRLKENVSYDFDATTRLKQLKPARFNFIGETDRTVDGFLAHEVSDIVPEAISGEKDETETKEKVVVNANGQVIAQNIEQADWEAGKIADKDGNTQYPTDSTWEATKVIPVYQGIDQSKLVPLLVKTIQELEARITALENQP